MKIFSFRGRLSRGQFLSYSFLLVAVMTLLIEMFADDTWSMDMVIRDFFRAESCFAGFKEHYISISLFFIFCYIALSLVVRRLHDLGRSGWSLINPFKNPLREFDVFFKAGDPLPNKYDIQTEGE